MADQLVAGLKVQYHNKRYWVIFFASLILLAGVLGYGLIFTVGNLVGGVLRQPIGDAKLIIYVLFFILAVLAFFYTAMGLFNCYFGVVTRYFYLRIRPNTLVIGENPFRRKEKVFLLTPQVFISMTQISEGVFRLKYELKDGGVSCNAYVSSRDVKYIETYLMTNTKVDYIRYAGHVVKESRLTGLQA